MARAWLISGADVQPGRLLLARSGHHLVAGNKGKEENHDSKSQRSFGNTNPLTDAVCWRYKAKSVQRRRGREKRLVPRTDCACSPVQEGEGSHRAHEIHDDQQEYVSREQPKQDRMSVLNVKFSSEPNYDRFVHNTASDQGKKWLGLVPLAGCTSWRAPADVHRARSARHV